MNVMALNSLISDFDLWGPFWRENGRGQHAGALVSGDSKPDQKVRSRWDPFGSLVISKLCYKTF